MSYAGYGTESGGGGAGGGGGAAAAGGGAGGGSGGGGTRDWTSGAAGNYAYAAAPQPPPSTAQKAAHLQDFANDESSPRTVYVGGLAPSVSEELIMTLFSQIGPVSKCKVVNDGGTEPYAFVEFGDHETATQALIAMNKRILLGNEMKVNWATAPGATAAKVDTSKHFHVFVGDLSPEVDNKALKDAFQTYGEISDCKVIRDSGTLKSKGYGFVSFIRKEEAEKAIEGMNGQWLGRRTIRTNWATRKPGGSAKPQTYDEVFAQTNAANTTVYVGGTPPEATEEQIRTAFSKFGPITEVRLFKSQGYCFVRFDSKDSAAHAIVNLNGQEVAGATVRCSWGRQPEPSQTPTGPYGYAYGYGGSGAQGYAAAAAASAAAPNGSQAQPSQANQAAWNQYWQQYYANPAMMQQWQQYYAQHQTPQ